MQAWLKVRDNEGRVVELRGLDPKGLHRVGDEYVQTVAGRPWAVVAATDVVMDHMDRCIDLR